MRQVTNGSEVRSIFKEFFRETGKLILRTEFGHKSVGFTDALPFQQSYV